MNTHHILGPVSFHDRTRGIEQCIFDQCMIEHMQQRSLYCHGNKQPETSCHQSEILHRRIGQHTFNVALHDHKRNGQRNCQQSKEQE